MNKPDSKNTKYWYWNPRASKMMFKAKLFQQDSKKYEVDHEIWVLKMSNQK